MRQDVRRIINYIENLYILIKHLNNVQMHATIKQFRLITDRVFRFVAFYRLSLYLTKEKPVSTMFYWRAKLCRVFMSHYQICEGVLDFETD